MLSLGGICGAARSARSARGFQFSIAESFAAGMTRFGSFLILYVCVGNQ
jgi:hypothetical protein